ncbi:MAG: HlyC/CorC family transporter [Oscillospiraceae bacterium]|nr:HlyC/CorC family transporter [Oscillospiraceae bacterium]
MVTDGDRLWLLIALLTVCCLLRAWYSACEAALTELNDALIHQRAAEDQSWGAVDRLISQPSRMRRSFTMHRIFSALFIGVLCNSLFGGRLRVLFPFPEGGLLAGLLLSLGVTVLLAAVTDMYPKRVGKIASERLSRISVPSVRLLMLILTPFWAVASGITALFCMLTRIPAKDSVDVVTEEEIRLMVDAGNETGGIEESQREMINNIFTFDDVSVSDVMTHRRDMVAVPVTANAVETAHLAAEEGFSRIPVYEDQIDTIVGIVLVKDLLPLVGKAQDHPVTDVMRAAVFVPETAKCRDVFQKMRREKMQLAIVSDEYGGTAGMVTMEDLLEEIVGSIQDEYDNEEAECTELSPGVYSIAGTADPEDILPMLGLEADGEFDTMSAYVVNLLGRIPNEGERHTVEKDGVEFTLLSYEDHWISRIQAQRTKQPAEESGFAP